MVCYLRLDYCFRAEPQPAPPQPKLTPSTERVASQPAVGVANRRWAAAGSSVGLDRCFVRGGRMIRPQIAAVIAGRCLGHLHHPGLLPFGRFVDWLHQRPREPFGDSSPPIAPAIQLELPAIVLVAAVILLIEKWVLEFAGHPPIELSHTAPRPPVPEPEQPRAAEDLHQD